MKTNAIMGEYQIQMDNSGTFFIGEIVDGDYEKREEQIQDTPGVVPQGKPEFSIWLNRDILLQVLASMQYDDFVQFNFYGEKPVVIAGEEMFAVIMPARAQEAMNVQEWARENIKETEIE